MIKISYGSEGKIDLIWIQINNCWAEVPWHFSSQTIDWSQISYQHTREVIKLAWEAWSLGKDLSVELAPRADLAPVLPKPQPNWNVFNLGLLSLPAYNNLMSQVPGYLSANLSIIAGQFATNNFFDYTVLKTLWDMGVATAAIKPTAADIASLNKLAEQNNMPFQFSDNAKLLIS